MASPRARTDRTHSGETRTSCKRNEGARLRKDVSKDGGGRFTNCRGISVDNGDSDNEEIDDEDNANSVEWKYYRGTVHSVDKNRSFRLGGRIRS